VRTLHPFTLITIAVALPALAWILPAPWGGVGTVVVAGGLLLMPGAGSTIPAAWTALLTAAPFWFFLILLHGPGGALDTGLRLTTMIGSSVWLVAALPPPRLVEAMVARGWPVSVAFLLSSTLSAVPALRLRAARLVEAQRSRGLRTRGGPLVRLAALRALALPLVLSALHEVDERALALETRGLAPGIKRTPLAPPPDTSLQRSARWGVALACVAALVWRIV